MSVSENGKVIIITGTSQGLGLAMVEILLKSTTSKVLAVSRKKSDKLTQLEDEFKDRLYFVQGDVSEEGVNKKAVELAIQQWGKLDGLILNAGIANPIAPTHQLQNRIEEYKNLFAINFFAIVDMLTVTTEHLRASKGKIIMVSSGAATSATAGWGPYNTSKAAVNSLARTFANEEQGITTVSIRPGTINTAMQAYIRESKDTMLPHEYARFDTLFKEDKLSNPSVVGKVIAGLALNASHELNGKFINWDEEEIRRYAL